MDCWFNATSLVTERYDGRSPSREPRWARRSAPEQLEGRDVPLLISSSACTAL